MPQTRSVRCDAITGPVPYIAFDGCAREALSFYAEVFGGRAELHTFADFGRSDGPAEAIAHGTLLDAPVAIYAGDAAAGEPAFQARGLMFALLGTADPATLREWFARLADGGEVLDDLQERGWNASDGQLRDRDGVCWLVGFENDA